MFEYKIDENFNEIISESARMLLRVCGIQWNGGDYKVDIRKWHIIADEESVTERASKGVSLNPDDAKELGNILVEKGYCDDDKIARILEERHNIKIDIKSNEEDNNSDGEFYSPQDILK